MCVSILFFFFNDPATTEIYTLSLHDALPICTGERPRLNVFRSLNHIYAQVIDDTQGRTLVAASTLDKSVGERSEEHTSELQSLTNLVCRLLLEKKKT